MTSLNSDDTVGIQVREESPIHKVSAQSDNANLEIQSASNPLEIVARALTDSEISLRDLKKMVNSSISLTEGFVKLTFSFPIPYFSTLCHTVTEEIKKSENMAIESGSGSSEQSGQIFQSKDASKSADNISTNQDLSNIHTSENQENDMASFESEDKCQLTSEIAEHSKSTCIKRKLARASNHNSDAIENNPILQIELAEEVTDYCTTTDLTESKADLTTDISEDDSQNLQILRIDNVNIVQNSFEEPSCGKYDSAENEATLTTESSLTTGSGIKHKECINLIHTQNVENLNQTSIEILNILRNEESEDDKCSLQDAESGETNSSQMDIDFNKSSEMNTSQLSNANKLLESCPSEGDAKVKPLRKHTVGAKNTNCDKVIANDASGSDKEALKECTNIVPLNKFTENLENVDSNYQKLTTEHLTKPPQVANTVLNKLKNTHLKISDCKNSSLEISNAAEIDMLEETQSTWQKIFQFQEIEKVDAEEIEVETSAYHTAKYFGFEILKERVVVKITKKDADFSIEVAKLKNSPKCSAIASDGENFMDKEALPVKNSEKLPDSSKEHHTQSEYLEDKSDPAVEESPAALKISPKPETSDSSAEEESPEVQSSVRTVVEESPEAVPMRTASKESSDSESCDRSAVEESPEAEPVRAAVEESPEAEPCAHAVVEESAVEESPEAESCERAAVEGSPATQYSVMAAVEESSESYEQSALKESLEGPSSVMAAVKESAEAESSGQAAEEESAEVASCQRSALVEESAEVEPCQRSALVEESAEVELCQRSALVEESAEVESSQLSAFEESTEVKSTQRAPVEDFPHSKVTLFPGNRESFLENFGHTSENIQNISKLQATDPNLEHISLNLQYSPDKVENNEDSEEEDYELYKVCSPLEARSKEKDNSTEITENSSHKNKPEPRNKLQKFQNIEVEDSKLEHEISFLSVDSETSNSNISPLKSGVDEDVDDVPSNISEKELSSIETESGSSEHTHEDLESDAKKRVTSLKRGKKPSENKIGAKVETPMKSIKGSKIRKGISKAVSSNPLSDEVDAAPTRLRTKHYPPTSIAKKVIPEDIQVTQDKISKGSGKDGKGQNSGDSSTNKSPVKRSLRSRSQDPTSSTSQNVKKLDSRSRRSSADTDKASESCSHVESSASRKRQAQTPDIKFKEYLAASVRSSPRKPSRSTLLDSSQSAETRESGTPKKQNRRTSNETVSESKAKGTPSSNASTPATARSNLSTTTSMKTRRTKD